MINWWWHVSACHLFAQHVILIQNSVCVWVASGLRLGCVWVASGLRLGCIWVASGLRLGYIWVASGLRLGCVWETITYLEVARFGVPPLRTTCDPNTKLVARFGVPPLLTTCDPNTNLRFQEKFSLRQKFEQLTGDNNLPGSGTFRLARFGVPPLRTTCDPNTKLGLRLGCETITYLEVARFGVPPLRTTCDPNTNLRFQEKFSLRQKFEHLTGDNNLHGSGTFRRATSSRIETITYVEVARFGVPPLRVSCDPNTKLGLRLGCVWVASGLRLGCVWVVSGLRLGCVWVASGLRLGCVWVASGFPGKILASPEICKETITYVEVARFGVPPLRTTCDPNTNLRFQEKFSFRQKFEQLTGDNNLPGSGTFRLARFGVPPLRTTCDPNTNLRFQEKFSFRQKFEQLTGDNNLLARFGVPHLRASCGPNKKLGLWGKFTRCQKLEFLTGEYVLLGGGIISYVTSFLVIWT
ncbi:LOW QUALITY PROTEIN: hypothetical protein V1477_016987 [Vespula maculifrons]|uniref:Uncharacterized protein n=1 Tax=Vespula maculifrons TaxID=7453 RepID=A0ABD2B4R1_VESMC